MFSKIITTCKDVTMKSKHVKTNFEVLDEFISNIECSNLKHWLSNNPYGILDMDIETIINFIFMYESIDYSFWGNPKWTISTPEGNKDGADALMYAMIKYVKESNNTDFSKISLEEFEEILRGNVEIPLLIERYDTLVENSKTINEKMNGNLYKYIYDVRTDEELFNIIISNFSSFKDDVMYEGENVCIYKLAQLVTSDILHIRERIENIEVDYSNLIGCADYKIPQTLRALKIVEYDKELADLVDSKNEIAKSSEYEVEIRANQIYVIDYITQKMRQAGIEAKSIDVNDYLFVYSKNVKDIAKPYHLCRTTNY